MNELDEKIKFGDNPIKIKEISHPSYSDETILVKTFIDQDDKVTLYQNYVDQFFGDEELPVSRFLSCKYSLMLGVLALCTNIDIGSEGKNLPDLDQIEACGLWDKIIEEIINYNQVKKDLYALTKMISEERLAQNSIGKIVDSVYQKIVEFIDNADMEKIEEIMSEFKEGIKKLENDGIVVPKEISQKE